MTATPAFAAKTCDMKNVMEYKLSSKYGEIPIFSGFNDAKKVIVKLWINEKTGSWSATTTNAFGVSCLVDGGGHGFMIPPPIPGQPS